MTKQTIKEVKLHNTLTGKNTYSDTTVFDVDGTDLGIPVYSKKENNLWLFFGDTFSTPLPSDINWRGTVIGKISNFNFKNGIKLDSFVCEENGSAKNLIKHHKSKNEEEFEVTKIAQGAIEIDGVMYAFYESIRKWGEPGYWDVNYSGVISSTDGGHTWKREYDLTWVANNDKYKNTVKQLAEEDENFAPSGAIIDIDKHYAPAFAQIFPFEGNDGYVYITGRRGGRQFGACIARVNKSDFLHFDEYAYYVNIDGQFSWINGVEGLRLLNINEEASYIVKKPVSNFTISFNKYLNVYFKPFVGIVLLKSDTPYGPYIDEEIILKINDDKIPNGHTCLYGDFAHELLSDDNGKIIYVIVSQWNELYYGSHVFKVVLKYNCVDEDTLLWNYLEKGMVGENSYRERRSTTSEHLKK